MTRFDIKDLSIEGLKIITPFYMEDDRGFFLKSFEKDVYAGFGVKNEIYEDFESGSKKGVVRGLHFQTKDMQTKMVRVISGEIFDVAVDIRKDSGTFGKYEARILNDNNHEIFYIPEGFAHGFMVLSDYAIVSYKCAGKFLGEYDSGIRWNDPDINIDWPNTENIIISEKDSKLMSLEEYKENYLK